MNPATLDNRLGELIQTLGQLYDDVTQYIHEEDANGKDAESDGWGDVKEALDKAKRIISDVA